LNGFEKNPIFDAEKGKRNKNATIDLLQSLFHNLHRKLPQPEW